MLVAYSNWNHVKNIGPRKAEFADAELVWLAYVAGKRETRRLMGDHILTYDDVFEERKYPDGTCCTTWAIDLHYPMPANQRNYDGEPFRSICTHDKHYPYPIPYRCFYSRNVPNLFMAGRDISVTHVALGTTRVMRTHGMMGEVVGMAASICKKRGCDRPRFDSAEHSRSDRGNAVEFHLVAGIFAVEHGVAHLEHHFFVLSAVADGEHFAFEGFLFRSVGNDDACHCLFFCCCGLNEHAVSQWFDVHSRCFLFDL